MKTIAIVGAGGFAREVRWLLDEINSIQESWEFRGFVVSDLSRLGEHDSRELVLGDLSWLDKYRKSIDAVAIGIGSGGARLRLSAEISEQFPELEWPALVHPTVRLDAGSCSIGGGSIICAGTVATVNVKFDPYCLVNLCCTIGHEAVIGEGSVVNPSVSISGGVRIGKGALIGTGARILQYVTVGAGASVGAGAVVTKDVSEGTTVVGIPARPLQGR